MKEKEFKYSLAFRFKDSIFPIIATLVFLGIALFFYYQNIGGYIFVLLFVAVFLILDILSFYRIFFKKILIYDRGFSHQTSPFKKVFYEDSEIEDAWISDKHQSNGITAHYFNYKAKNGEKGQYYFPPYLYDYADYLCERIKGNDVADYERHLDMS